MPPTMLINALQSVRRKVKVLSIAFGLCIVVASFVMMLLGLVVIEFPSAYASDADDYLLKGLDARDGWRGDAF